MNWKIAEPLTLDHMPAEVATEMLANPKARLTARQRRQCFAARQRVFVAPSPMRRILIAGGYNTTRSDERRLHRIFGDTTIKNPLRFDADDGVESDEIKRDRKFARLPLAKLGVLVRRSRQHRRIAQTAFEKLIGDDSKMAIKMRRLLELAVAEHESIQDSAQTRIDLRMARAHLAGMRQYAN